MTNPMPLDPRVARMLELSGVGGVTDRDAYPLAKLRADSDAVLRGLTGPEVPCHRVEALELAGAPPARLYRPAEARGTLLFFHGGGFTIGSVHTHDNLARTLAETASCRVVSVEYRLAPEFPFPAGHDDARAAARALVESGAPYAPPGEPVAVFGDSAGGSLALAASRALARLGRPPALQLLAYPVVDFTSRRDALTRHATGGFLTADAAGWFLKQLLRAGGDPTSLDLSPILAPDLEGTPPTHLTLAEYDPLVDDGRAYAAALRAAGARVEVVEYPDQTHGFLGMAGVTPRAVEGLAACAAALRAALAPS